MEQFLICTYNIRSTTVFNVLSKNKKNRKIRLYDFKYITFEFKGTVE